jgi:hypothetical protein
MRDCYQLFLDSYTNLIRAIVVEVPTSIQIVFEYGADQ